MKKTTIMTIAVLFLIGGLLASCAQEPSTETVTVTTPGSNVTVTATTTATNTITATQTVTVTSTAVPTVPAPTETAGALAVLGGQIYSLQCDVDYCHEGWDAGGEEEFAGYNYSVYKTAKGFFDFVKLYMPNSFPGSITDEEYVQVSAFVLTELNKVPSDALFGLGNLSTFELE
ncbi:MAG: hypothetical protein JW954_00915 [Dehalococcoidaceae bacterium]|nr:hypothetical protein [Dehalococcoidaceae bacterium]